MESNFGCSADWNAGAAPLKRVKVQKLATCSNIRMKARRRCLSSECLFELIYFKVQSHLENFRILMKVQQRRMILSQIRYDDSMNLAILRQTSAHDNFFSVPVWRWIKLRTSWPSLITWDIKESQRKEYRIGSEWFMLWLGQHMKKEDFARKQRTPTSP